MTEIELNNNDKQKLKVEIKISMILGLLISIVLVVIVGVIPGLLFLFGKQPSEGFLGRSFFTLVLLFIPFLAISWTNILKYIDLKKGKKQNITTTNYKIIKKKDNTFIVIHNGKQKKIKIDHKLIDYINLSQPLILEISKFTKSLLFISHDNDNLLDKLYNDENQ
jgi:hypothetical protein